MITNSISKSHLLFSAHKHGKKKYIIIVIYNDDDFKRLSISFCGHCHKVLVNFPLGGLCIG